MLSPFNNEKVDLMNIVEAMYARELEKNEVIAKYLKKLLTYEILPMNPEAVGAEVQAYTPFVNTTEHFELH